MERPASRRGEMTEWLKVHAWKACVGETLPRVRIPLSPPHSRSARTCRSEPASGTPRLSPLRARIPLLPPVFAHRRVSMASSPARRIEPYQHARRTARRRHHALPIPVRTRAIPCKAMARTESSSNCAPGMPGACELTSAASGRTTAPGIRPTSTPSPRLDRERFDAPSIATARATERPRHNP